MIISIAILILSLGLVTLPLVAIFLDYKENLERIKITKCINCKNKKGK